MTLLSDPILLTFARENSRRVLSGERRQGWRRLGPGEVAELQRLRAGGVCGLHRRTTDHDRPPRGCFRSPAFWGGSRGRVLSRVVSG